MVRVGGFRGVTFRVQSEAPVLGFGVFRFRV